MTRPVPWPNWEQLGWKASVVSGDAQGVVQLVAQQAGMAPEQALGEVSPEQKLAMVQSASAEADHRPILMIGDGVNDAAALAAADVGIAVQGGAEASLAAADIYVAAPGLMPLVDLVRLARRTAQVARRNLIIAFGYNAIAISLAAAGYITPLIAALLMPASSIAVLANAMSLSLNKVAESETETTNDFLNHRRLTPTARC